MSLPETLLAWSAGFIDGEGYIGISWNSRFNAALDVSQKDLRPLHELQSIFNVGKVYDEPGRWHVGKDEDVYMVLSLILPYLRRKDYEAKYMLRYLESRFDRGVGGGALIGHTAQELRWIIAMCELKRTKKMSMAHRLAMTQLSKMAYSKGEDLRITTFD